MCRELCCPPARVGPRKQTGGKAPGEQSSLYMVQNPAYAGQTPGGPEFVVPPLSFSPTTEQASALAHIEVSNRLAGGSPGANILTLGAKIGEPAKAMCRANPRAGLGVLGVAPQRAAWQPRFSVSLGKILVLLLC